MSFNCLVIIFHNSYSVFFFIRKNKLGDSVLQRNFNAKQNLRFQGDIHLMLMQYNFYSLLRPNQPINFDA